MPSAWMPAQILTTQVPHSPGPLDVSKDPIPGVQPSDHCVLDLHPGENPTARDPIVGPTPFQGLDETNSLVQANIDSLKTSFAAGTPCWVLDAPNECVADEFELVIGGGGSSPLDPLPHRITDGRDNNGDSGRKKDQGEEDGQGEEDCQSEKNGQGRTTVKGCSQIVGAGVVWMWVWCTD